MSDVYLFKTLACYFYNYTALPVIKTATDAKQASSDMEKEIELGDRHEEATTA